MQEALKQYHDARKQRTTGGDAFALRGLVGRFIDVCDAIEYAHCRGILHRDLKPGNIMLGRFGETLVVDWGLARTLESKDTEKTLTDEGLVRPFSSTGTQHTLFGSAVGTPHYMSPEQAEGRLDELGPTSDVYSLGATLYCVLTGEAPIGGENVGEVLQNVQKGRIRPPNQLNAAVDSPLVAICLKALALKSVDRYSRAAHLAADLQRWLSDEPVTAYPENWLTRIGRWTRRHRTLVASGGFGAALLLLVLGISLWLISSAHQRETIAHQRADSSFRAARETVDLYFTQVSEDTLLNQPGLQTLRRDLLTEALKYYAAFIKDHSQDTNLKADLAQSAYCLGRIHEELGELETAVSYYDQASQAQRMMLDSTSLMPKSIAALSDTLTAQGRLEQKRQNFSRSSELNAEGKSLREKLVRADEKNLEYQRKLANSFMNEGLLSLRKGETDEAESAIRRAQSIRAPFVGSEDAWLLKRDQAKGFYNLGLIAVRKENSSEARMSFEKAATLFEDLERHNPQDLEVKLLFATSLRLVGDSIAGSDKDDAIKWYRTALPTLRSLANRNPEVAEYQLNLAGLLMNLANVQREANPNDALASINSAIESLMELGKLESGLQWQRDLAVSLRTRAALSKPEDKVKSLQDLEKAEEILSALVAEHPEQVELSQELEQTRMLLNEAKIQ